MDNEASAFPRFVVLLGIDGSGKSTIIESLRRRGLNPKNWTDLRNTGDASSWAPPEPTRIRSTLSPLARAIFVGGHLVAAYEHLIKPELQAGRSILYDSYYFKLLCKEQIYGVVHDLFFEICSALPKPDAVIYLDVSPKIALARKRDLSPYECIGETNAAGFLEFQTQLSQLLKTVTQGIQTVEIDGEQPSDEVSRLVYDALRQLGFETGHQNIQVGATPALN